MTELAPRLLKGLQADYVPAEWPGENTSGFEPYGRFVLIRVDQCSQKTGGGVYLTEEQIWKMDQAAETGCIYAAGPEAFMFYDNGKPWTAGKPEVGDRVYFDRYAGTVMMGQDGAMYRTMDFRLVVAGLTKAPTTTEKEQLA